MPANAGSIEAIEKRVCTNHGYWMQCTVKATVLLEGPFWVAFFEKNDDQGYAAARQIFGSEPSDPELYEFVVAHYQELRFSAPRDFKLVVKRTNPKRLQREVRREMEKAKEGLIRETRAQEVLRQELEKNKKLRKAATKINQEEQEKEKFKLRQEKKKKKLRGH